MLVCFILFRTRGCGCIGHPAFPAPSVFSGQTVFAKLGRIAPRECRAAPEVARLARRRSTKRPVLLAIVVFPLAPKSLYVASRLCHRLNNNSQEITGLGRWSALSRTLWRLYLS